MLRPGALKILARVFGLNNTTTSEEVDEGGRSFWKGPPATRPADLFAAFPTFGAHGKW